MNRTEISVQAPGRICLFGEHQDYLGYPVIAGAIDKYIFVKGEIKRDADYTFKIQTPNLVDSTPKILKVSKSLEEILPYSNKRDYISSCINVAKRNGAKWNQSWDVEITGNIPINAGASSSSAMVIAWIMFLFDAGKKLINEEEIGELGYISEVEEFGESGGMMDHFASACGNVLFIESRPSFKATKIMNSLDGFVLANSGVKKETVDDLRNTKHRALKSFDNLKEINPEFDRFNSKLEDVQDSLHSLNKEEELIARGNLVNRDLTLQGLQLLKLINPDNIEHQKKLGSLIKQHNDMLTHNVKITVPKIDEMVEIAMNAGAYGAKINGSGFGGTMFAYAPNDQDDVICALNDAGYDCWKISISNGAKVL